MDLTPVSKFRHVFCPGLKPEEIYLGFRVAATTGDQTYIKGNSKYFAIPSAGGGGPIAILKHHAPGRQAPVLPLLAGHKGDCFDFDFNPFCDEEIVSGSADCTIKLWRFPEGGLKETTDDSVLTLNGHRRKVTFVEYHPVTDSIIVSASADGTCKVWDLKENEEVGTYDCKQLPQDLHWNYSGALFCVATKDKVNRIFDPRENQCVVDWVPHQGTKTSKFTWIGDSPRVVTTGFSGSSQREWKLWDLRSMRKQVCGEVLDQSSGAVLPFFDTDTNIIYLSGKGDGNIRYYEVMSDSLYPLSQYSSTVSARGLCMLPKKYCDVNKSETTCILKLTSKGDVEPLSFFVPRKFEGFSPDLFPEAYAGVAALTNEQWRSGENANPTTISLDPENPHSTKHAANLIDIPTFKSEGPRSPTVAPVSPRQTFEQGSPRGEDESKFSLSSPTPAANDRDFAGTPSYAPKMGKLTVDEIERELSTITARMEFLEIRLHEIRSSGN